VGTKALKRHANAREWLRYGQRFDDDEILGGDGTEMFAVKLGGGHFLIHLAIEVKSPF